ncbi:Hypothetical protein, conserved [Brucella abortus str. 2308 A]|uniref:Uncharacterized protein n=1 Tax=Brucella ceti str. Cudo TaxID=595497 RepID=C0G8C9_9HYPH|nr:Hypothetical protein, conserved [Brucella ceti str. Cudo]EEP62982.1 Hypothetical protein, conserved [Brucella abortus str. 2308 A]
MGCGGIAQREASVIGVKRLACPIRPNGESISVSMVPGLIALA